MGIFEWVKPRVSLPSPRLRLVVFGTEETLPLPLQLVHPAGLWEAIVGDPSVPGKGKEDRLPLEMPMEPGSYLFKGSHAEVLATVEQRCGGAPYPGRDQRGSAGAPAGMSDPILHRLETARWAVILDLAPPGSEPWRAVLFHAELADRLAALSEGVFLDEVTHRYCLPGTWRVANARRPVDAREHVVIHMEIVTKRALWVHTHGLIKFGHPELEIVDLPEPLGEPACRLLIETAQGSILGESLQPGERVGDASHPMVVKAGSAASLLHCGAPSLELVDVRSDGRPMERGAARAVEAYRRSSWTAPTASAGAGS